MLTSFEAITSRPKSTVLRHSRRVLQWLQCHTTPDAPVRSRVLEHGLQLSGPEIRAAVHYLRTQRQPIGSSAKGYFWTTRPEELASTIQHGQERIRSIAEWVRGLQAAQAAQATTALPLDTLLDKTVRPVGTIHPPGES